MDPALRTPEHLFVIVLCLAIFVVGFVQCVWLAIDLLFWVDRKITDWTKTRRLQTGWQPKPPRKGLRWKQ